MAAPVTFSVGEIIDRYWPDDAVVRPPDHVLGQIYVSSADISFDAIRGVRFETEVVLANEIELAVPGFDLIALVLGGDAKPYGFGAIVHPDIGVRLGPVPVELRLRHPALQPIDRTTVDGVEVLVPATDRTGISVIFEATTLAWSADRGFELQELPVVTLPLVEIVGTGLIVGLDEVAFILRDIDWTPTVAALGFGPNFRGIVAESASVFWLPQLQLLGEDLPGLRLELDQVALGNEGTSFDVELSWLVELTDEGRIDVAATELAGSIFGDEWRIALQRAYGQVRLNVPQQLRVDAVVDVPMFDGVLDAQFGLALRDGDADDDDGGWQTSFRLASREESNLQRSWPGVSLTIDSFTAAGMLADNGFSLAGSVSFDADVFDLAFGAESVAAAVSHSPERDELTIEVHNVELGPLGTARHAKLTIVGRNTPDEYLLEDVHVLAEYEWSELSQLVPESTFDFDVPDEAHIEAMVRWQNTNAAAGDQTTVEVELRTGVSELETPFDFLPESLRPEIVEAETLFRLRYASATAFNAASSGASSADVEIEVRARLTLRMPSALDQLRIPGMDLLAIHAGDDEGLMVAEFALDYESGGGETEMAGGFELTDLISIELSMPGGRAAEPLINTSLTRLGITAGAASGSSPAPGSPPTGGATPDSDDLSASLAMVFEGDFAFRPYLPEQFPFASHLQDMLHQVGLDDVRGSAGVEVSIASEAWRVRIHGAFDDFGFDLDLFSLMSALASGSSGGSDTEIDIDFEIGFRLVGFDFHVGTEADGEIGFGFDLMLEMRMTGVEPLQVRLRLSDDEFALGIVDLRIPLAVPEYPIGVADLERLAGTGTTWTQQNLDDYVSEIEDSITALEASAPHDRHARREIARLGLRRAMLQLIMAVHHGVGPSGASTFQGLVVADTAVHETMLGILHVDTRAHLHFPDIKLSIPFDNPSGISLSGKGRIAGFAEDDPLKPIEDYYLTVGLSTEYIYARIESDGDPISLPLGPRYHDGTISIASFGIGYGYSKNSFAFDFKGQLDWPTRLIEDVDTSDQIGAGIRIPRHNRVSFKLDTIILTIGKATVAIPVPQFDIDLRTPGVPPLLVGPNGRVRPAWDGLEVIADNIVHADLKRIAFSPFFGPVVAPNAHFDGDIDIGTDEHGATLIVDDLFMIFGVYMPVGQTILPIPLVADPTAPYFENIAANVRIAGFEVNFRMQRPFPSASPLAAIEAFGLVSNPLMELDPLGVLANTIRFTIDNAYVRVPDRIVEMFPALRGVVEKRHGFTVNLSTLTSLVGAVVDGAGPVFEGVRALPEAGLSALNDQVARLPDSFDPWALLALMPPELRKFRVGGQLAGFEASACFVLATDDEARTSLSGARPAGPSSDVNLSASRLDGRRLVTSDESLTLFDGIEFRQFESGDVDLIGGFESDGTGSVFLAARVRVFGGQRVRFLGRMAPNGSFALISSAESTPLQLSVFGITVPLEISGAGRLRLVGNHRRTGYSGFIEASGWYEWEPIPELARLTIGTKKTPAELRLHSDGRFLIQGTVAVDLFGGRVTVADGTATVSEELAAFTGRLRYDPGWLGATGVKVIAIDVAGAGHLAVGTSDKAGVAVPVPSFAFEGIGSVTVLGQTGPQVRVEVSDRYARFHIDLSKKAGQSSLLTDSVPILRDCGFELSCEGAVDLRRSNRPSFTLRGEGMADVLGATVEGRASIRARPAAFGGASNDRFDLDIEGSLVWRGRRWVDGRLRVGSEGARIEGAATIGVALTPPSVAGFDLPHLHLELQVMADFGVDASAIMPDFRFTGLWQLGAVMVPGVTGERRQLVPLAGDSYTFDSAFGMTFPLLDLGGLQLLPVGDFEITMPAVNLAPAEGAVTMIRAGRRADNTDMPLVEFWTPLSNIGLGPGPYVGNESFAAGSHRVHSSYAASIDWDGKLGLHEIAAMSLRLEVGPSADKFPLRLVLSSDAFDDMVISL